MPISDLEGKQVAIMGLGAEGLAALRLLRSRLDQCEITILEENTTSLEQKKSTLDHFPGLVLRSGSNAFDQLDRFDVIIKSPGVSIYRPEIRSAMECGIEVTSGTQLWCDAHQNERLIIVTGTKGKSTTASLIALLLNASGRRTELIGNMESPALTAFSPAEPPEFWVMELSSYQAAGLHCKAEVAVLLNLFPEHTDWHENTEQYYRDKTDFLLSAGIRSVIVEQGRNNLPPAISSLDKLVAYNAAEGIHLGGIGIVRGDDLLLDIGSAPLPGKHNLLNICAALTAIEQLGIDIKSVLPQLRSFKGLPHRLTSIGNRDGIEYIDDSISTTPESALAALHSFSGRPCTQLLGGYDRDLDWTGFAQASRNTSLNCVVTLPGNAARITAALQRENPDLPVLHASDMADAVTKAAAATPSGGVIILSPGAPSYGSYRNFKERGEAFSRYSGFTDRDEETADAIT